MRQKRGIPSDRVARRAGVALLCVMLVPLAGCFLQVRQLRDDNTLLKARVLQYQQDYGALLVQHDQLRKSLGEAEEKHAALERDFGALREREAIVRRLMDESQRSQAEAIVRDIEERTARENELRLAVDDLTARVEVLANDKSLVEGQLAEATRRVAELTASLDKTTASLREAAAHAESLRKERDDARAERDDLSRQVGALQSNSTDLTRRVDEVSAALRDREKELAVARREAEQLRAAASAGDAAKQQDSEASARLLEALRAGLSADVASGNARIVDGPPVRVVLLSDALFEPRSVLLSEAGRAMLERVAAALAGQPWGTLRIEGHTDSQPVASMPFVDNWDLAAARASAVTRWFAHRPGIPAKALMATSHAFFVPAGPNETPEQRRLNRRVEIVVGGK